MVLPQLDAYHAGRQLQHLQPWVSVELAQQKKRGQTGTRLQLTYQYEAYAGFHVIHLHTDGAPLLLFSAPSDVPTTSPRELCEAGNLGNLEANVMAGRALLGVLQLPDTQQRCVILLVHKKVMSSGTSKNLLSERSSALPRSCWSSLSSRYPLLGPFVGGFWTSNSKQ